MLSEPEDDSAKIAPGAGSAKADGGAARFGERRVKPSPEGASAAAEDPASDPDPFGPDNRGAAEAEQTALGDLKPLLLEDLLSCFGELGEGDFAPEDLTPDEPAGFAHLMRERLEQLDFEIRDIDVESVARQMLAYSPVPTDLSSLQSDFREKGGLAVVSPHGRAGQIVFSSDDGDTGADPETFRSELLKAMEAGKAGFGSVEPPPGGFPMPLYAVIVQDPENANARVNLETLVELTAGPLARANVHLVAGEDALRLLFAPLRPHDDTDAAPARIFMLSDEALSSRSQDLLGYDRYAEALADLIDNAETKAPLTVAINAKWGVGKTSLARMVEERLTNPALRGVATPNVTYWFNAWMHDEATNLGQAFLHDLARFVDVRRPLLSRMFRPRPAALCSDEDFIRRRKRMLMFWWAVAILASFALVEFGNIDLIKTLKLSEVAADKGAPPAPRIWWVNWLLLSVLSVVFVKLVVDNFNTISGFIHARPNPAQSGSLAAARAHLCRAIRQVTPAGQKFVVFLDDLERCRPPRSIDVLEVVNQLLDFDPVVTVVIADMPAIATNAEIKYEKLSALYNPDTEAVVGGGANGASASRQTYGRLFLQKFVQLQFDLPHMRDEQVQAMIEKLMGDAPAEKSAGGEPPPDNPETRRLAGADGAGGGTERVPSMTLWRSLRVLFDPFQPRHPLVRAMDGASDFVAGVAVLVGVPLAPLTWGLRAGLGARILGSGIRLRGRKFLQFCYFAACIFFFVNAAAIIAYFADNGTGAIRIDLLGAMAAVVAVYFSAVFLFGVAFLFRLNQNRFIEDELQRGVAEIATSLDATGIDASRFDENVRTETRLDENTLRYLYRRTRLEKLQSDSGVFRAARVYALKQVTPVPRNTKRLMNRLRLHIGLLDRADAFRNRDVSPEQIGKWIVLQDRWPEIASAIAVRDRLIADIERASATVASETPAPAAVAAVLRTVGLSYPEESLEKLALLLAAQPFLAADIGTILNFGRLERLAAGR